MQEVWKYMEAERRKEAARLKRYEETYKHKPLKEWLK
jgi:hypothetical protein